MHLILEDAQKDFESGRYKDAIKKYNKIIEKDADNPIAYQGIAQCYYKVYKIEASEQAALTALKLNSNLAQPHVTLGYIYHHRRDYDQSEKEAKTAIELDPNALMAYPLLSLVEEKKGNFQRAKILIQTAIQLNPKIASFYLQLGSLEGQQGNLQESLNAILEAYQLEANNWGVLQSLGIIYIVMGKKFLSVKYFWKALLLHPTLIIFFDLVKSIANALKPFDLLLGIVVALCPLEITQGWSIPMLLLFSWLNIYNGMTSSSYEKRDFRPLVWRFLFNVAIIIIWIYLTSILAR